MAATIPTNGIVLSSGLNVADGDVVLASGHGISFAATSDVSGMASELLDDYEEGTWTGTFRTTAGHYTMASGYNTCYYTKVGNVVSVQAYLAGSSEGLDDGHDVKIDGLPFSTLNENSGAGAITVGYAAALNITAGHSVSGFVLKNNNQIQLTVFDAAAGMTYMNVGEL